MKQQYLLIEDVEDVGRSGEIISAKPGFARNYLVPQQKAVLASPHTLRMQEKLRGERAKKAAVDKGLAEELAKKLEGMTLDITMKADGEGKLYGSIHSNDLVPLFEMQGVTVNRKNVVIAQPIKNVGEYPMTLKLPEGVTCSYLLRVISETPKKGE